MSRLLLVVVGIVVSSWSCLAEFEPAGADGLQVEVTHRFNQATNHSLNVRLSNVGKEWLHLSAARLPWNGAVNLVLVVVELAGGGVTLSEELFIDDPGSGHVQLAPGQVTEGVVNIETRFPTLRSALSRHDVIVFWSCQPALIGGLSLERHGGWLLIKGASGSALKIKDSKRVESVP